MSIHVLPSYCYYCPLFTFSVCVHVCFTINSWLHFLTFFPFSPTSISPMPCFPSLFLFYLKYIIFQERPVSYFSKGYFVHLKNVKIGFSFFFESLNKKFPNDGYVLLALWRYYSIIFQWLLLLICCSFVSYLFPLSIW